MATATSTKLDSRTREILSGIEWEGEAAKLTCGQLTRAEYVKVNSVLETLGGQWSRKAKAHLFDSDARDRVEAVIEAGEFVDEKKLYQFYETPDDLADDVVRLAEIRGTCPRILEPSAGTGQIIRALNRRGLTYGFDIADDFNGTAELYAIEIDGKHEAELRKLETDVLIADFLAQRPSDWEFDYVVMNPPFAKQADIDHVLHAWKFLKPGGRLVAIMSPGWLFRTNRKSTEFKAFVDEHLVATVHNAAGAFKSSGTMVKTVTVVLDK